MVGPLLRRKLADTLSPVAETLPEAGDIKTACAMANAKSFGRRTQLLSGYGARGEDHDCRYGEHYVFYHWTLLLSDCHFHQLHVAKTVFFERTAASKKS